MAAIKALAPGRGFSTEGSWPARITFVDGHVGPSCAEIEAKALDLERERAAVAYRAQRAAAYPSIGDQLDALFKAGVFPTDMAARIQAVKDEFPKPSA